MAEHTSSSSGAYLVVQDLSWPPVLRTLHAAPDDARKTAVQVESSRSCVGVVRDKLD